MSSVYLVRFDDLCPTMNWDIWERIEEALFNLDIRPLVGVIPNNQDPALFLGPPRPDFWERVRKWQANGWSIALHGYEHRYVTAERGLYGWNDRSEFAGLALEEQQRKLDAAVAVFEREGIRPDAWMAPNHSFDTTTLIALRRVGITTITDGLGLFPHLDEHGMFWVPVQLWGLLRRQVGVWTACLHHNQWQDRQVDRFVSDLDRFSARLRSLPEILDEYHDRRRTWVDVAFATQRRARKKLVGSGLGERHDAEAPRNKESAAGST